MYCAGFLLVFLLLHTVSSESRDEFTINIDPGSTECFYKAVKSGEVVDLSYQVIDGDQGDIDINFHLYSPTGRQIVSDFKKGDEEHRIEAAEDGDYKMCWDNTISSFNTKTVFFEILIDPDKNDWSSLLNEELAEERYEMKVKEIMESISRVHVMIGSIRKMQDIMRAHEARDRHVIESNYSLVNNWSLIQIFVMVTVGAIQVIMVRSLFDDKSRVHQMWKTPFLS